MISKTRLLIIFDQFKSDIDWNESKELIENKNASYKAYAGLAKSYASLGFYKKAKKNYPMP